MPGSKGRAGAPSEVRPRSTTPAMYLAGIGACVVLAALASSYAITFAQGTDLAGVAATHQAQAAGLGCIYSRTVQVRAAQLVPGVVAPAGPSTLGWHFNEPPVTTLLAAPLAGLDIRAQVCVWEGVLWLSILACGWLLWRRREVQAPRVVMGAVVAVLLLNHMANTDFSLAQNDALLLVITLLALEALRRDRDIAAGVLLGLAAVKPQLMFLAFAALLMQRRWRCAAVLSGTAATLFAGGTLMVGPACSARWLASATQVGELQIGIGAPGTLARVTGATLAPELLFAALAVAALVALWRIRARVDGVDMLATAMALAVVIGLHALAYDVLFLAPFGMVVARSRPRFVIAAGWLFTAAQLIDAIVTASVFHSAFKATELAPLLAVGAATVAVIRGAGGSSPTLGLPRRPRERLAAPV